MASFDRVRCEQRLQQACAALDRELEPATRAALLGYVELVAGWNARVNLTGARDEASLCEVLLGDALVLARAGLIEQGTRIVDVGTGAGAPIIPLLLQRADLSSACIEPLHKRAALLRTASVRLGLHGRMVVHEQKLDPDAPQVAGGPFMLACSRATFEPELWLRVGLQLAPRVVVLTASGEPPSAPAGVALVRSEPYALPFSRAPRRVVIYERVG